MAWIESHTTLIRHKKTIFTAQSLKIPAVYVVGHLHVLWHSALEMSEDGDLSGMTPQMIADLSGYRGDAEMFVRCLIDNRWLDQIGDKLLIHDWLDYAGKYLIGKFKSHGREKLEKIWSKYGRTYGREGEGSKREVNGKSLGSEREVNEKSPSKLKGSVPTYLPNLPTDAALTRIKTPEQIRKEAYGY